MQHNSNRVIDTQEIKVVPDFVALSKALQNDMLVAAQHIRNALYDNPDMETLKIALIALDYPHFIPIENTLEALIDERNALDDLWWQSLMLDYEASIALLDKIEDLDHEIERRKINPCDNHFKGGWYITKDHKRMMAVPPHMAVDRDKACPVCRGWLKFPENFLAWDGE